MLTLVAVAVGAALAGRARGGSFDALAATKLARLPLLWAGLAAQLLFSLWRPMWLGEDAALAVVLASNLLIVAFMVVNRTLPGMALMAAGLILNVVVIGANHAMPVSAGAARTAGVRHVPTQSNFKHELLTDRTRLPWLGDVIPLPHLGEVLSVGDLVLVAGIGWLVYRRTRARLTRA